MIDLVVQFAVIFVATFVIIVGALVALLLLVVTAYMVCDKILDAALKYKQRQRRRDNKTNAHEFIHKRTDV